MLSTKEVKELLNGYDSYRGDCPVCGGRSSFSASNNMGEVAWLCFKASCKERGRGVVSRTVDQIIASLGKKQLTETAWELPPYLVSINGRDEVREYFESVHVYPLYLAGYIKLRYDPKQDRAVYLIEHGGKVVDAVGRLLGKGRPKWYRYGNSNCGVYLENKDNPDVVVITEDIPSACVASYNFSALALLGTELSTIDMTNLLTKKEVIVALDPDAYSKGVCMADRLAAFVSARAVLIPDDLKYYTPDEAKEIIDEY